jgi:hypothetical protein
MIHNIAQHKKRNKELASIKEVRELVLQNLFFYDMQDPRFVLEEDTTRYSYFLLDLHAWMKLENKRRALRFFIFNLMKK